MKAFLSQPSLRGKIIFTYAIVAMLILGVSLFAYEELRLLEEKILLRERVAELFDTALEIRRFERNYFLHGQNSDFQENAEFSAKLLDLLESNRDDFATLDAVRSLHTLQVELKTYRKLMDEFSTAPTHQPSRKAELEPRIRATGQEIVSTSEAVVAAERQLVRSSLSSFQAILFFSIVSVALLTISIGQNIARRLVRPLKQIEDSVNAIASGQRTALAMPCQDREIVSIINAFNQMLKELELRQKHLLRSEKLASMGTMVSGVAHELNNPLSNIWSSCQILTEDCDAPANSHQRKLLRQIDEQSIRARNIVHSLLNFSRERQFQKEALSLTEIVRETLRFIKGEIPAGLVVNVQIANDLIVPADRQRLQQALLNLIKNAIDATGAAGVVEISAFRHIPGNDPTGNSALLSCEDMPAIDIQVRDNGPGIPPEILTRIFDPFFTTKDVGKGMGLGLFIVYQIVEEHEGCIAASNIPGGGTAFVIRLPLHASDSIHKEVP
jgi:signal transduction histidine kinase